jgi:phosphatidylglycerol lysyltransferase
MLLYLRDEGYRTFNLGLAPFAGVGESADSSLLEKIMHGVGERVGWFAGLGRLRQYKSKFEPAWEDRFLVYDRSLFALPRIGRAMAQTQEEGKNHGEGIATPASGSIRPGRLIWSSKKDARI